MALTILAAILLLASTALAQRIEATAGFWRTSLSGTLQSGIAPVDFKNDLGVNGWFSQFSGALVAQPWRRHKFRIDATPLRFDAANTLRRRIAYAGRVYELSEPIESEASLTLIHGGYQFDLVSRERGHFGLGAGIAWADAGGTIRSVPRQLSAAESVSYPLPLAGADFRVWAIPRWLSVEGGLQGLSYGRYGYLVRGRAQAGFGVTRWLSALAGYQWLEGDIHERGGSPGVAPSIRGLLLSIQIRDHTK